MPDNIVTGSTDDERLELQEERPDVRPARAQGEAVQQMPQPQITPPASTPVESPVPDETEWDPRNYNDLVYGMFSPLVQHAPEVSSLWMQQAQNAEATAQSVFSQSLETANTLPNVPLQNNPSLRGYLDQRYSLEAEAQRQRANANANRFGRVVMPYESLAAPPTDDPRVPYSTRRVVPGLAPGSEAMGRRMSGDYEIPRNGWARTGNQISSLGRMFQGWIQDTLRPADDEFNWEADDFLSIAGNLVVSPQARGIFRALRGDERAFENAPSTLEGFVDFITSISPEETGDEIQPYTFDPSRGYFGEMGAGIPGAALYGLALPGQLVMAGVYGVSDLAMYLSGREPHEGYDPNYTIRLTQALTGQDLGFTNFRDGSGGRYLSLIQPDAPRWQQIAGGVAGFALDATLGGALDNALYQGARTARLQLEALGRTGDIGRSAEMVSRLENIRRLRLSQNVPRFRTPTIEPQSIEVPTGSVEVPSINVEAPLVPIPDITEPFIYRSNDDLLRLGQNLETFDGTPVIPPEVRELTNNARNRLEMVYGDIFARYGNEVPVELVPQPRPSGRLRVSSESPQLSEATRAARRWLERNATEDFVDEDLGQRLLNDLWNVDTPNVPTLFENTVPRALHVPDVQAQSEYLRLRDGLLDSGRATRSLEENLVTAHTETVRAIDELDEMAPLARGHIMDEYANMDMHTPDAIPEVQVTPRQNIINEALALEPRAAVDEGFLDDFALRIDEMEPAELADVARRAVQGELGLKPETVRDVVRAASGRLNRALGGGFDEADVARFRNDMDILDFTDVDQAGMLRQFIEEGLDTPGEFSVRTKNALATQFAHTLSPAEVMATTDEFTQSLRGQWFHGSKVDVEELGYIHPEMGGSSNELGAGLYLTRNRELAEGLYAKLGRNSSTVINGSARVSATGNLYTVDVRVQRTLDVSRPPEKTVRQAFVQALGDTFGNDQPLRAEFMRITRGANMERYWLDLRQAYANVHNSAMSELDYRRYSASLGQRLRNRGYDSLYRPADDTLVVLDQPGRALPVVTVDRRSGIGTGSSMEAKINRQIADRMLNQVYGEHPVTAAWLKGSDVDLLAEISGNMAEAYNDALARGRVAVDDYLDAELALREDAIDNARAAINDAERVDIFREIPNDVIRIDTDNPCL